MHIVSPEVTRSLPLPTLLSQPLVAFTIECDNEFEHQMAQWKAPLELLGERDCKAWTVSLVMWSNFMRFLGNDAIPFRKLNYLAHLSNIAGLERWGYICVTTDPADMRPKPPRSEWLVRPTAAGRIAQEVWGSLIATVEARWRARYGSEAIEELRQALLVLVNRLGLDLPEFLPVIRYGLSSTIPAQVPEPLVPAYNAGISSVQLPSLLSKFLLAFTMEFERESNLSLAICANILRIIDAECDAERVVLVRDLPRLAGVSKEAVSMATGYLERNQYGVIQADPIVKGAKSINLTQKGVTAKAKYNQLLASVENDWKARFGADAMTRLRKSLAALYQVSEKGTPTLSVGLHPYPDGWRARKPYVTQTSAVLRDPACNLPHFPMVLHRGGYPDGS